jgi:DNA-directed RNA polymerase subunit RPC12/RpoP
MNLNCVECGYILEEPKEGETIQCRTCGCVYEKGKLSWLNRVFWQKQVKRDVSHTPLFI